MNGSYKSKEENEGYIGDGMELETRIPMQSSQVSIISTIDTINH